MIIAILLQVLVSFVNILFLVFPDVTTLPFGIDAMLVTGMGYVHYIAALVPPLQIMLNGFLFVILFKTTMMVFRAIPIIGRMIRDHGMPYH